MAGMQYFLIVFDRRQRRLLQDVKAFSDSGVAMKARFDQELTYSSAGDVEIVVLGASSYEALRSTHSRYFESVREPAEA